jgi:hypothetical protein
MSDARDGAANSLHRAVRFLLGSRPPASSTSHPVAQELESSCQWKDFSVFGRSSDQWVTAYAAVALAETGIPEARAAAEASWRFLTAERGGSVPTGLGYNREAPRDADSTQWGCRLAVLLGHTSDDWFGRSVRFLVSDCFRPDNGIATYPSASCLPFNTSNNTRVATDGWTSSHVCVTAAAAWLEELLAHRDLVGFLAQAQVPQGYWNSYWWVDREYATAHALESLSRHGLRGDRFDRAVVWLESRPPGSSSFQLALRIIAISAARPGPPDALLPDLLASQLADGSWPSSARMRIPPPDLRNPEVRWNWDEASDGFGGIVVDRARIFTTATAVRALTSCLVR